MALDLIVVLGGELLLRLNHAEVDILLMRCGYLLLLCLQGFNLLCKSELLNWMCQRMEAGTGIVCGSRLTHQRCHLRRTPSMSDVEASASGTGRSIVCLLIHAAF